MSLLNSSVRASLRPRTIGPPFSLRFTTSKRPGSSSPRQQEPADAAEVAPKASNFYKQYTRPYAKVFLMAMFTYQVLYWGWEKLRLDELREEKNAELKMLETIVADYQSKQELVKRP